MSIEEPPQDQPKVDAAAKLKDPPLEPAVEQEPIRSNPTSDLANEAPVVGLGDDNPIGFVEGLPPIPSAPKKQSVNTPRASVAIDQAREQALNRASSKLLVFTAIGLLAFAAGIGLAILILTGAVDLQAQWVRDLLRSFRG